jgi:hypothetical protein
MIWMGEKKRECSPEALKSLCVVLVDQLYHGLQGAAPNQRLQQWAAAIQVPENSLPLSAAAAAERVARRLHALFRIPEAGAAVTPQYRT